MYFTLYNTSAVSPLTSRGSVLEGVSRGQKNSLKPSQDFKRINQFSSYYSLMLQIRKTLLLYIKGLDDLPLDIKLQTDLVLLCIID